MLLLVSLTEERAIYLALELDRSWTEMIGVQANAGMTAHLTRTRYSPSWRQYARSVAGVLYGCVRVWRTSAILGMPGHGDF